MSFHYSDSDLYLHHTLTEAPDENEFTLHAHDRYEIYCFLSGQGYYTVEGHDYSLLPGCMLLMRDGETHKLHIRQGRAYERIALHFSPSLMEGTPYKPLLHPFCDRPLGMQNMLPPEAALGAVCDMLQRITKEDIPRENQRTRILSYLPAILFEIGQVWGQCQPSFEVAGTTRSSGAGRSLVGDIIEFINRDPAAVSGIEMLEERFGFSRSYLNRTFRQSTGVSIWDYVILKRLTQARLSIRAGVSAASAAAAAGYTDYSSFYRQYKKRFGVTPEEEKRAAGKR